MKDFLNLEAFDFRPLSEAKARLSALVRQLVPGLRRVVITTNGKPTAVLMSYEDYLTLARGRGSELEGTTEAMDEKETDDL